MDIKDLTVTGTPGSSKMEPHNDMEFDSNDAAYEFYKEYAKSVGIGTAKLSSRRSRASKEFIDAKFSCIRYGNKQQYEDAVNPWPSPKIGFKASMHVKRKQNGKWYIYSFVKEHNHELLPSQAEREVRWTGAARSKYPISERFDEVQTKTCRFNDLCHRAIIVSEEGSLTQERTEEENPADAAVSKKQVSGLIANKTNKGSKRAESGKGKTSSVDAAKKKGKVPGIDASLCHMEPPNVRPMQWHNVMPLLPHLHNVVPTMFPNVASTQFHNVSSARLQDTCLPDVVSLLLMSCT